MQHYTKIEFCQSKSHNSENCMKQIILPLINKILIEVTIFASQVENHYKNYKYIGMSKKRTG